MNGTLTVRSLILYLSETSTKYSHLRTFSVSKEVVLVAPRGQTRPTHGRSVGGLVHDEVRGYRQNVLTLESKALAGEVVVGSALVRYHGPGTRHGYEDTTSGPRALPGPGSKLESRGVKRGDILPLSSGGGCRD